MRLLVTLIVGALFLSAAQAQQKEQRVALVIGNASYKDAPLRNPVNDANDVAATLKGLGFQVILRVNSNRRQMVEAVREFGTSIKRGGVGLFYYSGHGVQSRGKNFLVPVGAHVEGEGDLEFEAMDANMVLAQMDEAANRVNILVLDACRDNPFARSFRSTNKGLAQMDSAKGSFLAYATSPGSVASDGEGRNGTYTKHLLTSLRQPDTKLEEVFKRVRLEVARETGNKQIPWDSSSLLGDFYFTAPGTKVASQSNPIIEPQLTATQREDGFWNSIKDSRNKEEFSAYLSQYPKGHFAQLAHARIKALESEERNAATTVPTLIGLVDTNGKVMARVNGTAIPQSRLDAMVKGAAAQGQPDSPEFRNRAREELITREILMQEAAKKGTDKTPDVLNQLEIQRQSLMQEALKKGTDKAPDVLNQIEIQRQGLIIQTFLNDYVRSNPVSDEDLRKEYDSAKAAAGAKEYKARHILVKEEAEAKQIIAQLKKGGNFEKIAAEKSEDTGSKSRGGDLDWASPARYVKPFSDALVKLKKGQITDTPVQSPFGWHIIRLDDERATKLPPFEDVKNNIQQQLQQQVVQKLIADLRSKAKIE